MQIRFRLAYLRPHMMTTLLFVKPIVVHAEYNSLFYWPHLKKDGHYFERNYPKSESISPAFSLFNDRSPQFRGGTRSPIINRLQPPQSMIQDGATFAAPRMIKTICRTCYMHMCGIKYCSPSMTHISIDRSHDYYPMP